MAFWPALLLSPIQRQLYGRMAGWLLATAIRSLLPPVLIVIFFYGYISVLGTNQLVVDIAIFIIAIFSGELLGHMVMPRPTAARLRLAAAAVLMIAVVAFSTLTFIRPSGFLFKDPHGGTHGVAVAEPDH
jgi:hypothetical protein